MQQTITIVNQRYQQQQRKQQQEQQQSQQEQQLDQQQLQQEQQQFQQEQQQWQQEQQQWQQQGQMYQQLRHHAFDVRMNFNGTTQRTVRTRFVFGRTESNKWFMVDSTFTKRPQQKVTLFFKLIGKIVCDCVTNFDCW